MKTTQTTTRPTMIPAPLDPAATLSGPALDKRAALTTTIADRLDQVTGRATRHTHNTREIMENAHKLYNKIRKHVPACHLVGSAITLSSQPSLPRAYGSRKVIHTVATVSIRRGGLYLDTIERVEAWATPNPGPSARAHLTPDAQHRLGQSLLAAATTA